MKRSDIIKTEETIEEVYLAKKYLVFLISIFYIIAFIPSIIYNFILSGPYIYLALFEIILVGASGIALYYIVRKGQFKIPAYIDSFIMFGVTIATMLATRGQAFDYGLSLLLGITVFTLLRLKIAMILYISGALITIFFAVFLFGTDTQTIYNLSIFIILSGGILYVFNYSQQMVVDKLINISYTDVLTGLWNRKKFDIELKREIKTANRNKLPLTIMMTDIDLFKRVNDKYGHDAGDEYLVEISNFLFAQIRETDILARWGGEEFSFIFPNTSIEGAKTVAEKILNKLNEKVYRDLGPITMSMGLTSYKENEAYDEFFNRADKALYISKNNGRNKFTLL